MSQLRVLQVGPVTSVQDFGRFGGQRYGLGTAGALDRWSLAAANALVGSRQTAPAIEIGPFACRFKVEGGAVRIALCGASRPASINGRTLAFNSTALIADGETLDIRAAQGAVFSYLAMEGGIAGEPIFGSFSVHARLGLGAPFPRALASGDVLTVGNADQSAGERRLALPAADNGPIRIVLGPQDDYFTPAAIAALQETVWRISATSDRMGYRLEGPPLAHAKGHNIVSDGITNGAIQVPGNGQPLVLLADRGTTGGYPKIAVILSCDLHRFAQIPAGGAVRFKAVSVAEAQTASRAFAAALGDLPAHVGDAHDWTISAEALLAANLAGQAVDAQTDNP
ncbi:biotin-dependent carboxyltransferase family protein [Candidatus Raskinella chloraquaticus]|uniref:Allophanate hydrolase n=1 Tax=Candidatus Raskinella chloraquaticus TaxID=1951219 RepID=A0A1W9HW65_9HYPH|nr:MAG: allophanate hydrolase [Proteobacteria bacterium SG_bin8]